MDHITINPEGIYKLLTGLKIHTATGPDELEYPSDELALVISLFFQA